MNIFLRELKTNLKSLIIWGIIVVIFVTIGMAKFSAYVDNPEMLAMLNDLPPAALAVLNMQAFNLTTITGFFGVMFTYFSLILSIAAAMWGSDIISKEERDKTVEFSLTLPVTRGRLVTGKTLAALVNCIGLLLITWIVSLVNAAQYHPDAAFYNFLRLCMLALFIMQLTFLAMGVFLGCSMKKYKLASSVALSVLLGTYFLSIISEINKNLDFLKYFSPFRYFDPASLLHNDRINMTFVGLSLGIILVSMVGAYLTYSKRDLYI